MPSIALMAQKALNLRHRRRLAVPAEIGPYTRIQLEMTQTGKEITLDALTGASLQLHAVWLRISNEWLQVATWEVTESTIDGAPVRRHRAVLDLDVVVPEPEPETAGVETVAGAQTTVWVSASDDREKPPPFATAVVWGESSLEYRVPLGRFHTTPPPTFSAIENSAGQAVRPYINGNGHLSLAIDREVRQPLRCEVASLQVSDGRLVISGVVGSPHAPLDSARLVLVGRDDSYRSSTPVRLEADSLLALRRNGASHYTFTVEHDFRQDLQTGALSADTIADLWLEGTTTDGREALGRVGRSPYLVRRASSGGWLELEDRALGITPYYTFKAKMPSLHLEIFSLDTYRRLRTLERTPRLLRPRTSPGAKPVWIVGERPYKAQDNGLHLFRHLRQHHPEIDAYYVIDKDSPERRNLAGLDHVLDHKSPEHVDTMLRADRLIGTHHADYLYPTRAPSFARRMTAPKVFLQHGVMGTKWMAPNYGKSVPSFETDLFLVSSKREKEYIVQDFGYRPDEVAVTGLSRFDALFDGQTPAVPGQILVLPTWRDWLQDPDGFTETEYFEQWRAFITSPRLRELLERHGGHVVFCLHPNMQRFSSYFETPGVRVVLQGEVDVQQLLKESEVLVTDYSSPGFDFSFLDKPVLYFQFDVRRFLGRWGSHLDLENELPGPIAYTLDGVLDNLAAALERGSTIEPQYAARAARFLTHRGGSNNERIIEAIQHARRDRPLQEQILNSEVAQLLLRRARKHPFYFPAMRRLLAVARLLPARDATVFESGLGKQYGDSPRFIYEELVRRGDPRPKIWVYNRAVPVWDPELVVVERLSPGYFWHLGRSRYWVNNQNFPHYVRRRRDGVYVQTWHGTPLKRMLHDLHAIVGRDEGYFDRVNRAISQWTTLLSPSPYATEAFRSAFRYEGDVLEVGYPRNDILSSPRSEAIAEQVRQKVQIPKGKRVVLYAPTFRDNSRDRRGFAFELPFDLERFAREAGEDTVLLLRMHVLIAGRLQIPEHLRERVIDVSRYPEIQELFLVSDVLVTDYSSVFFDYALLRRPMIFHAYDLETYRDDLRGFYVDYEATVPGPVTTTEDELFSAVRAAVDPEASPWPGIDDFIARFAPHDDGHSAARVVDAVLGGGEREVSPREP